MRWLIVLLLGICSASATAQDWIILQTNDTIYCHILSVDQFNIQYKTISAEPPRSIPRELVRMYHKFEEKAPTPTFLLSETGNRPFIESKENREKGIRLGLLFGYSYLIGRIDDGVPAYLKEHTRKLKSGYNVKADITYFFGRFFGMGSKYSIFKTRASTTSSSPYVLFSAYTSTNNISVHFIGAHFTSRFSSSDGFIKFLGGVTGGYVTYKDAYEGKFASGKLTAQTIGLSLDFDLDFRIFETLYLGITVDYVDITLSKKSYGKGQNGQANNLRRMDMSIGLRFYP